MNIIEAIFFACFVLLLLSGAGLALGRLIMRLVIRVAPDFKERVAADDRSAADEAMRPWHFSE